MINQLKILHGSPTLFRCLVASICVVSLYTFIVLLPFEKLLERGQVSSSPRFIDTYKGFKLYEYMGYYYGLDEVEYPVVIKQINTTSKYSWLGNSNFEKLKQRINQDADLLVRTNKIASMFKGANVSSAISPPLPITPDSPMWIAQSPPIYPEWIVFNFQQPVMIKVLAIHTHTDSVKTFIQYHPKDFILQGSMDGSVWVDVMKTKNNTYSERNQWTEWGINNNASFTFYRIYITAGNPDYLSIFEIKLS